MHCVNGVNPFAVLLNVCTLFGPDPGLSGDCAGLSPPLHLRSRDTARDWMCLVVWYLTH